MVDDLPAELEYVPNSLRLGERPLTEAQDNDEGSVTNHRIEVKLREPVASGEVVQIHFQAVITGAVIGGAGIINTATMTAANAPTVTSSEAIAIFNPFGTVYAARGGADSPVAGARVALLVDDSSGVPLGLASEQGFTPNEANTNPFLSNGQGRFGFFLTPSQIGTATARDLFHHATPAIPFAPVGIDASPARGALPYDRTLSRRMTLAIAGGLS